MRLYFTCPKCEGQLYRENSKCWRCAEIENKEKLLNVMERLAIRLEALEQLWKDQIK